MNLKDKESKQYYRYNPLLSFQIKKYAMFFLSRLFSNLAIGILPVVEVLCQVAHKDAHLETINMNHQ